MFSVLLAWTLSNVSTALVLAYTELTRLSGPPCSCHSQRHGNGPTARCGQHCQRVHVFCVVLCCRTRLCVCRFLLLFVKSQLTVSYSREILWGVIVYDCEAVCRRVEDSWDVTIKLTTVATCLDFVYHVGLFYPYLTRVPTLLT